MVSRTWLIGRTVAVRNRRVRLLACIHHARRTIELQSRLQRKCWLISLTCVLSHVALDSEEGLNHLSCRSTSATKLKGLFIQVDLVPTESFSYVLIVSMHICFYLSHENVFWVYTFIKSHFSLQEFCKQSYFSMLFKCVMDISKLNWIRQVMLTNGKLRKS